MSVERVCSISGWSGVAVWRINSTMTLRMYLTHESSSAGGSCHEGAVECSDGACVPALRPVLGGAGESGEERSSSAPRDPGVSCCDHLEAIVMDNTFNIKSWDCRTSMVGCPVCTSIC